MRLLGSGAGEATQPTPHRQEWTPPAAARKPMKTEKASTPRNEPSDNWSRTIVVQTFRDLGKEFEHRRSVLLRGCKGLGSLEKVNNNKIMKFSGPLSVCVNAKVRKRYSGTLSVLHVRLEF